MMKDCQQGNKHGHRCSKFLFIRNKLMLCNTLKAYINKAKCTYGSAHPEEIIQEFGKCGAYKAHIKACQAAQGENTKGHQHNTYNLKASAGWFGCGICFFSIFSATNYLLLQSNHLQNLIKI